MRLAKPAIDVGLSTNRPDDHLVFWRTQAALPLEGHLAVGSTQMQHRFDALGSVVKVNGFADALPLAPRTGYRELIIVRPELAAPVHLADPDGSLLTLVPPGWQGVQQIAMRMGVRDIAAHRRFYRACFGLREEGEGRFRAGESLLILEQDAGANPDASRPSVGWRYITFQVFKADDAHAHAMACGAVEARAVTTLGDVARFSIIRDPDGNAIELSQRKSIIGSLD